ncbi:hypothetical protein FGO68_gene998 [Halteria grandinella]|uniref:Uncharacterized protein n=1 Tax=Halteria grandinella TaxID=5974 RepID=A0A8J8P3F1_HALGN|nr:hypothetical protein FGO68_gene998 [Halteria grandinella]
MVGNISIDGFKRERYVVKVKDISDELVRAYHALNEEEAKIETQYAQQLMDNSLQRTQQYSLIEENKQSYSTEKEAKQYEAEEQESYMESIRYITSLLLKIETLEESKKQLLAKLVLKEKKWIENDKIFKERRFTLMSVLQYDLALAIDCSKHLLFVETVSQRRLSLHEKYVLMINQVFERNRLKSLQFISDIKEIVTERQDQLVDLKLNFDELIIKDKQIEDDIEQMKRQINEMTNLANMRKERDYLNEDIQDTELRITQLKKVLGINDKLPGSIGLAIMKEGALKKGGPSTATIQADEGAAKGKSSFKK